ncbi:MAG: radical SAM family heme chaperone HemW, partial [Ectothiorhodospiraceae bacterium]|nr:radical SAM family heme chaperone HemW [Ectothiorhodospiraceae bacterium]
SDLEARLEPEAEITLEANPGTMEQDRFAGCRAAGVNRRSIGVQSCDPYKLARLGRIHGRDEAIHAAESAVAAGFSTYNLDLMFALPGQSLPEMLEDLEQAIALQPPHLSHYQLTLEPNTVFHAHPPPLPDDDTAWAMQQAASELLARHGYGNYEVSAWSLPGHRCGHNLNYWAFGDYLAIGAGAHGKLTDLAGTSITRYRKAKVPAIYMHQTMAGRPDVERRALEVEDLKLEFMMNALRLTDGFPASLFEQRTGLALEELRRPLDEAIARGWLEQRDDHIRTTSEGRCYLNEVLTLFLP